MEDKTDRELEILFSELEKQYEKYGDELNGMYRATKPHERFARGRWTARVEELQDFRRTNWCRMIDILVEQDNRKTRGL